MYRASWTCCLVVVLLAGILQAQSRLSIRAASREPVEGWQRMQVEHSDGVIWVSPTAALTASDIEQAQPEIRADGYSVIRVVFTDAGVNKLHDLTAAQPILCRADWIRKFPESKTSERRSGACLKRSLPCVSDRGRRRAASS